MKWTGGKCVIPYHREFSLIPTPIHFSLMSSEEPTASDPVQQTPILPLATSLVTSPTARSSAELMAPSVNNPLFGSTPPALEHTRNEISIPATPMSSATLPLLISRGQWYADYQVQDFRQHPPADIPSASNPSSADIPGDFYHYDHLAEHEYRVLLLRPALNNDEPLAGQLCRRQLIRYGWDDFLYVSSFWRSNHTSGSFISIDHQRSPKTISHQQYTFSPVRPYDFRIPKTLEAALRKLRLKSTPIPLFVDYICIDNRDSSEKEMCYAQLTNLISHASKVIVWLGDDPTNKATKLFTFLMEELQVGNYERLMNERNLVSRWRELATLLSNTKLGRRWIYEEIVFARRIELLWGPAAIDWVNFCQAVFTAAIIYNDPRYAR